MLKLALRLYRCFVYPKLGFIQPLCIALFLALAYLHSVFVLLPITLLYNGAFRTLLHNVGDGDSGGSGCRYVLLLTLSMLFQCLHYSR